MVKTIFTSEQRQWLQLHAKEYNRRVQKLVPGESGSQYARACAEQFASRWTSLADGKFSTREEIVTKVMVWFKNSNQAGRNPPLLSIEDAYPPNASQIQMFTEERRSKVEAPAIVARTEQLDAAALSEQQARRRQEERARLEEQITAINQTRKITNRELLKTNLERVLQSYSDKTDASFYVLMALPSNEANGSPSVVSRFECSSMPEFPSFQTFCETEERAVLQQWREYAEAMEKRRALMVRVKDLITLDGEGYPEVPPVNYNLNELGEALTAYLEHTWYKLHEKFQNVHDTPWTKIKTDATKYINLAALPSLLLPFQIPTRSSPEQILGLQRFLEGNARRPFGERFPFIVQTEEETCEVGGKDVEEEDSPVLDLKTETDITVPIGMDMSPLPPSTPPPLSTPSIDHRQTIVPCTTPPNSPLIIFETPSKNKRPRDDDNDTAELHRVAKIPRRQNEPLSIQKSNVGDSMHLESGQADLIDEDPSDRVPWTTATDS